MLFNETVIDDDILESMKSSLELLKISCIHSKVKFSGISEAEVGGVLPVIIHFKIIKFFSLIFKKPVQN